MAAALDTNTHAQILMREGWNNVSDFDHPSVSESSFLGKLL
jgi:hypothetical protein